MPYEQKCPFTPKVQELHSGQRRIIENLDTLVRMMEQDDEGFTSFNGDDMKERWRKSPANWNEVCSATLAKKLRSLQQGQMTIVKYVEKLLRMQELDDEGYLKRTRTFQEREKANQQNSRPGLNRRRTIF